MKKLKYLSLVLILILVLPSALAVAQAPDKTDGAASTPEISETGWYIIEFKDPSLVVYARSRAGDVSMMSVSGKLNVNVAASQSYTRQLEKQQATFRASLAQAVPGAKVGRGFQIALNAVAVELPDDKPETLRELRAMPGVKRVSPERIYAGAMDASLPLINASALWDLLGGRENAGAGVKVAVIDSGIDPDHPMFDGTGWSYPTTGGPWPKGDASFCNGKIIAARYYTPTWSVHVSETLSPQDNNGHGTHTAGTAVGNPITATYGAETPRISGVSPGAWLMVYKVLYSVADGGVGSTMSSIQGLSAVEDAIADGADVLSNSWGWWYEYVYDFPLTAAYEAAVDAGIVVVFAGGNDGPEYNTLGNPTSPKFIKVGASTTKRTFYTEVQVTAPTPVSPTLASIPGKQFTFLDPSVLITATLGPLPYIPCDLKGNPDTSLPGVTPGLTRTEPYFSAGWIALIPRGTYNFDLKLDNAIKHGASAAVIYTDGRPWDGSWYGYNGTPIYATMIPNSAGLDARNWWTTYTNTARLQIDPPTASTAKTEDVIADFSSRGPNLRLEINPDVVAPGVDILSSFRGGVYEVIGGTSMATPHVAGAAALLLAQHPSWTPAQVKSALMSTANQNVLDTDKSTVADVMTQGAGRIDLSKAGDPGLTFDEPSHSFGMVATGSTVSTGINATDVSGAAESYAISVQETITDTGNVTITVTPVTLNVAANSSAAFTVTLEVGAGATIQDIEGNIVLSGATHVAHIPYWARIYPPSPNDILLIDDDLSGTTGGFADYQFYYTSTLNALGLTYDIWDTTEFGDGAPQFPTRDVLDRYDTVVYFSGDGQTYFWWWWQARWENELRSYLAGGGKMLAFGQDAAWGMNWAEFDTGSYFGAWYDVDDAFGGKMIPQPSAVGVAPFLAGKEIDFSSGGTGQLPGDGASNMTTVDALDVVYYWSDMSNIPLFKVPETFASTQGTGYVGSGSSSDPTLERVADPIGSGWFRSAWRSTFCSFGLEAVNDNTGYYTRAALLSDLFDYVNDDISVSFAADSYSTLKVPDTVHFTATITSSVGAEAVQYRWDFGDGSAYATTTANNITHQYTTTGVYNARVEVTDVYSHTAIDTGIVDVTQTYTLEINLDGRGTVALDPEESFYVDGTVVTLTAEAALGWEFVGWEGDLTGADNPATITMDADKVVTATFTALHYTLDVNTVGEGVVTIDPEQETYLYGDVVILTAVPNETWYFAGWSGDATGANAEITVTIEGDMVITATFVELPAELTISKSVTPEADLRPGDTLTYTITLENSGEVEVTGVILTDVLPSAVEFGAFVENEGEAVETDGEISWSGNLAVAETLTIVFTATVSEEAETFNLTIVPNKVVFTSENAGTGEATASFTIKPLQAIYLPLVMRIFTP